MRRTTAREQESFTTAHRPRCKMTDTRRPCGMQRTCSVPRSSIIQPDNQALQSVSTSAVSSLPNRSHPLLLYDGSLNGLSVDTVTVSAAATALSPEALALSKRVDQLSGPPSFRDLNPVGNAHNKIGNLNYRNSAPPVSRNSTLKISDQNSQLNLTETRTKLASNLQPVPETPPPSNDEPTNHQSTKVLPDFTQTHRGPYVGLYNHGNTCYMSVIFQCLRFTPSFFNTCRLTQAEKTNPQGKLLQCVATLLEYMDQKANHKDLYDAVETIRAELSHIAPQYKESEQQDAVEFLLCVLDSLHSELKHVTTSTSPEPSQTQIPDTEPAVVRTGTSRSLEQTSVDIPSEASSSDNGYVQNGIVTASSTPNSPSSQKSSLTKKRPNLSKFFRIRKRSNSKKNSNTIITSFYNPPSSKDEPSQSVNIEGVHPAIMAWDEENMRESSPIKDTFMGQLQTCRECKLCGWETLSYGVVWNLSVPIPNVTQLNDALSPTPADDPGHRNGSSHHNTIGSTVPAPGTTSQLPPPPIPERTNPLFDGSLNRGGNTWPSRNGHINSRDHPSGGYASPTEDSKLRQSQSTFYTSLQPSTPRSTAQSLPLRRVPLAHCLKAYTLTELLDGSDQPWCQRCQQRTPCLIQSSLSRLPDVLVIHLLRFHSDGRNSKNTINVTFEMKLDMSEYMTSEYDKRHRFLPVNREENDHLFWLYAVVYHDGVMNYGHYTAACRIVTADDDQSVVERWYQFDDEIVREIKPELVKRASAYLLFYERDSIYKQRLVEAAAAVRKKRYSCILPQTTTVASRL